MSQIILKSKPGITSVSASQGVPLQWSQEWFRHFIATNLQLADARNAIPGSGITISGNITSYATIGLVSQAAGFGTPTGASIIANFPGASASLAQTSATVAEILTILKSAGLASA